MSWLSRIDIQTSSGTKKNVFSCSNSNGVEKRQNIGQNQAIVGIYGDLKEDILIKRIGFIAITRPETN